MHAVVVHSVPRRPAFDGTVNRRIPRFSIPDIRQKKPPYFFFQPFQGRIKHVDVNPLFLQCRVLGLQFYALTSICVH